MKSEQYTVLVEYPKDDISVVTVPRSRPTIRPSYPPEAESATVPIAVRDSVAFYKSDWSVVSRPHRGRGKGETYGTADPSKLPKLDAPSQIGGGGGHQHREISGEFATNVQPDELRMELIQQAPSVEKFVAVFRPLSLSLSLSLFILWRFKKK